MQPKISIIIAVYNAVRSLELVLAGYCRQSARDFEVFIADDGSDSEVRLFVDAFSRQAPFPIRYVSQPDKGFHKSRILNQAVSATSAPYLIFADADCIPHCRFVAAHWNFRADRTVLCGRRVNLSPQVTAALSPKDVLAGKLERISPGRFLDALLGRANRWDEGVELRNPTIHRWINYKEPTLQGCNFSAERSLLEEINGFNEDFVGYGGEDTELEYRLRLTGADFRWVRHRAIQYHLHHRTRSGTQANLEVLKRTQDEGKAACRNGLKRPPGPLAHDDNSRS
jgi:glycosyltransferase involved in cell wall biosynthesis